MPEADEQAPSPYLRRSKRVEVRRGARWKRAVILGIPLLLVAGGVVATAAYGVGTYLSRSPRFTLHEGLRIAGAQNFPVEQIARVFAIDEGHSVFDVPLEKRREQLMALPWIQSAWVLRAWPNRLRVQVTERRPLAFVRGESGGLDLIDGEGVLLPLPRRGKFPFPVLIGANESTPVAERRKRVTRMLAVLEDLDRDTPKRGSEVSEIDLSDPDDAAITVAAAGSAIQVHLGDRQYLERYRYFLRHVDAWREQYGAVHYVDLRYEKQVIVR